MQVYTPQVQLHSWRDCGSILRAVKTVSRAEGESGKHAHLNVLLRGARRHACLGGGVKLGMEITQGRRREGDFARE